MMIPALSLHQPWSSLVCTLAKTTETRSWPAPHQGWTAIHAASSIPSYLGLGRTGTVQIGGYTVEKTGPGSLLLRGRNLEWPYRLPLGAIVAVVEVLGSFPIIGCDRLGSRAAVDAVASVGLQAAYVRSQSGLYLVSGRDVGNITDQLPYGDFTPGRWGWALGRVQCADQPIPCAGYQRLWDVSRAGAGVAAQVEGLIARAKTVELTGEVLGGLLGRRSSGRGVGEIDDPGDDGEGEPDPEQDFGAFDEHADGEHDDGEDQERESGGDHVGDDTRDGGWLVRGC